MALHAGIRWKDGEPEPWRVALEGDRVTDEGPSSASKPEWAIFDGLFNYHTHVGDAAFTGRPFPHELDALVRPGTGWKHLQLAKASREELVGGIKQALMAYGDHAIRGVLDFREQGPEGLLLAREASRRARGSAPKVRLLARPAKIPWSAGELEALFHLADGIGIPGVADWGLEVCRELADEAHRRGKLVALHFAESRREGADAVLSLRPHLLVHVCKATESDLRLVHDAGVPVAVCPSSNEFFGLRPPVALLERLEMPWVVGTDNAMLGGRDLLAEARILKRWNPRLPDDRLASRLTLTPGKVLNQFGGLEGEPGVPRRLALLPLTNTGGVQWDAKPLYATR